VKTGVKSGFKGSPVARPRVCAQAQAVCAPLQGRAWIQYLRSEKRIKQGGVRRTAPSSGILAAGGLGRELPSRAKTKEILLQYISRGRRRVSSRCVFNITVVTSGPQKWTVSSLGHLPPTSGFHSPRAVAVAVAVAESGNRVGKTLRDDRIPAAFQ
jgi:hypothetical protein